MKQNILLLCLLCFVTHLFGQVDGKRMPVTQKIANDFYIFDDPYLGQKALKTLHDEIARLTRAERMPTSR